MDGSTDGSTTTGAPLSAGRLRERLVDGVGRRWERLDVVEQTGSTNADLLAAAAELPDRTVLLAEYQSRGRGRHSRAFVAPPRSQVAVSALVDFSGADVSRLGWLPLLTGIVVVDTARAFEVPAQLKWPNDVLVGDHKLAGILVEVAPGSRVVIGVGLNVHLDRADLPVPTATSMDLEGADADRTDIAEAFLGALADGIDRWRSDGMAVESLAVRYRELCATLGQQVRVELPGGTDLVGTARDVDDYGRLIVVTPDGASTAVSAGDVTHVRPIR